MGGVEGGVGVEGEGGVGVEVVGVVEVEVEGGVEGVLNTCRRAE